MDFLIQSYGTTLCLLEVSAPSVLGYTHNLKTYFSSHLHTRALMEAKGCRNLLSQRTDAFVITFSPTCRLCVGLLCFLMAAIRWLCTLVCGQCWRGSLQRCVLETFCLVYSCLVILVCLLLNQHEQGAASINYLVSLHPLCSMSISSW